MRKCHLLILCLLVCGVIACICSSEETKAGDYPSYRTGSKIDNKLGEFCHENVFYFVSKKPVGSAKGEVYAAGCMDKLKKLVLKREIERSGKKYTVVGINDYAFEGKDLTSVSICDSVSYIGIQAFKNCRKLTTVVLPQSLKELGDYCFSGCEKLKNINIPNSLKRIPRACFSECRAMKKIVLGDSVTELGDWAFSECVKLATVKLDKKLKNIGESCFSGCSSIKSINLPASVKTLGEKCFYYCEKLKSITIPKNVETVPTGMCEGCSSLEWVKLGRSVKTIGQIAFFNCKNLKKVKGGINVRVIGYGSFRADENLTSFNFGPKITKIDDFAFSGASLTEIDIPDTVTYLGCNAFLENKFETLDIPGSIKELGEHSFYNCENLTSVKLGKGVEIVGESAFSNCSNLVDIDFPSTVHTVYETSVDNTPWYYMKKGMQLVTPANGKPFYSYSDINGRSDYSRCTGSIIINDVCIWVDPNTYSLDQNGYWRVTPKSILEIPSGVKKVSFIRGIGDQYDKVVFPEGVEELDECYLQMNAYVKNVKIVLPDSLKRMTGGIYGEGLKEITIPKNVEYIGKCFFQDTPELTGITFEGEKLKEIGQNCFNRTALTSIKLPDSVTTIGNGAFQDSAFEEIILPKSLKTVGDYVFDGTKIKSLILPDDYEITAGVCNLTEMTLYADKGTKAYKAAVAAAKEKNARGSEYNWKVKER